MHSHHICAICVRLPRVWHGDCGKGGRVAHRRCTALVPEDDRNHASLDRTLLHDMSEIGRSSDEAGEVRAPARSRQSHASPHRPPKEPDYRGRRAAGRVPLPVALRRLLRQWVRTPLLTNRCAPLPAVRRGCGASATRPLALRAVGGALRGLLLRGLCTAGFRRVRLHGGSGAVGGGGGGAVGAVRDGARACGAAGRLARVLSRGRGRRGGAGAVPQDALPLHVQQGGRGAGRGAGGLPRGRGGGEGGDCDAAGAVREGERDDEPAGAGATDPAE